MEIEKPDRRWSDGQRINALDAQDLAYWTKFLGVDAIALFEAVDKVGTSVDAVKAHLEAQGNDWISRGDRAERRRPQH